MEFFMFSVFISSSFLSWSDPQRAAQTLVDGGWRASLVVWREDIFHIFIKDLIITCKIMALAALVVHYHLATLDHDSLDLCQLVFSVVLQLGLVGVSLTSLTKGRISVGEGGSEVTSWGQLSHPRSHQLFRTLCDPMTPGLETTA